MGYIKVISPSEIPLLILGESVVTKFGSLKDTHIHKHIHFISLTTTSSNKWEIYTLEQVWHCWLISSDV